MLEKVSSSIFLEFVENYIKHNFSNVEKIIEKHFVCQQNSKHELVENLLNNFDFLKHPKYYAIIAYLHDDYLMEFIDFNKIESFASLNKNVIIFQGYAFFVLKTIVIDSLKSDQQLGIGISLLTEFSEVMDFKDPFNVKHIFGDLFYVETENWHERRRLLKWFEFLYRRDVAYDFYQLSYYKFVKYFEQVICFESVQMLLSICANYFNDLQTKNSTRKLFSEIINLTQNGNLIREIHEIVPADMFHQINWPTEFYKPQSLKSLCRNQIRNHLQIRSYKRNYDIQFTERLKKLELPKSLHCYLLYLNIKFSQFFVLDDN